MSNELKKATGNVHSSAKVLYAALVAWLVAAYQSVKNLGHTEVAAYESYPSEKQITELREQVDGLRKGRNAWLIMTVVCMVGLLISTIISSILLNRKPQVEYRDQPVPYTVYRTVTVTPTPNGTPTPAATTTTPKVGSSATPTVPTTTPKTGSSVNPGGPIESPTATATKAKAITYSDFPKSIVRNGMTYDFFGPAGLDPGCAYYATGEGFDWFIYCLQG